MSEYIYRSEQNALVIFMLVLLMWVMVFTLMLFV